jgi:phosphoribosylpyrophosphate synthetase
MNEISERAAIAGYVAMAARSASTRLVDAVDVPSVETYEDAGAVIDEVITTNSVPADWPKDLPITVLSIAPLLSDAIRRIHGNNSVTDLFPIKGH